MHWTPMGNDPGGLGSGRAVDGNSAASTMPLKKSVYAGNIAAIASTTEAGMCCEERDTHRLGQPE